MAFNLTNLEISIMADDYSRLLSQLPLMGGKFSEACRRLSCACHDSSCGKCTRIESCSWYSIFGQRISTDPSAIKRYQKPSLPFTFSFTGFDSKKCFTCSLVVIGNAISHLSLLLCGFDEMLRGFSACVTEVASRDYQGTVLRPVSNFGDFRFENPVPNNLVIASTADLLERCSWGNTRISLQLLSPLRLIADGRLVNYFEFGRFARSVMRRVSSLSYYYGESEIDCDFKRLSGLIDEIQSVDQHFMFSHAENMKCSGITGYGTFEGDFSSLLAFLIIGSYVHTGKGSTFGMGAYTLTVDGNR